MNKTELSEKIDMRIYNSCHKKYDPIVTFYVGYIKIQYYKIFNFRLCPR